MPVTVNKSPRGRPRAFAREPALERAMAVFWRHGYDGASMPRLTEAMGISAQSLYAAFISKEALYREAIALYRATIGGFAARALDEEADALDGVARLLRDAAEIFARTSGVAGCMITSAPGGIEDEPLTIFGRSLRAESVMQVALRLERGRLEGQVRDDADEAAWARFVGSVVQGMSVQARDGATVEALRSTAELAAEAVLSLRPAKRRTRIDRRSTAV